MYTCMSSESIEGKDISESVESLSYPETIAMFVYNRPDALMFWHRCAYVAAS